MEEQKNSSVDGTDIENDVETETPNEVSENDGEITTEDKKIFAEIKKQNKEMKSEMEKVRQTNLKLLEKLNVQEPQKTCEELMNEMF